jgi:hypothetical protein
MAKILELAGAYLAVAAVTSGFYLRHSPGRLRNGTLFGIAWPLYWLVVHGLSGTIVLLVQAIFDVVIGILDNVARLLSTILFGYLHVWIALYLAGVLLTPGILIYERAAECTRVVPCARLVIEALAWALVWPSYLIGARI